MVVEVLVVIKRVIEAAAFMVIGAALFAANPRIGTIQGFYIYSCTVEYGLRWKEETKQLVIMKKLSSFGLCS